MENNNEALMFFAVRCIEGITTYVHTYIVQRMAYGCTYLEPSFNGPVMFLDSFFNTLPSCPPFSM